MENKLNTKFIRRYSAVFAAKVNDDFFSKKKKIEGKDIIQLTSIQQVNLFTMKALFGKWQEETNGIKSPFFDYENENVKNALSSFMNTLSKYISIERDHFEGLLREAVEKTILLIFSPYDFYCQEIRDMGPQDIAVSDLKRNQKYIRINGHLLLGLIEKLESIGEAVETNKTLSTFDDVCADAKDLPEDFDQYISSFSSVIPITLNEIYSDSSINFITSTNNHVELNAIDEIEVTKELMPETEVIEAKIDVVPDEPKEVTWEIDQSPQKKEPIELDVEHIGKNLNDQFVKDKKTLNDQIKAKLDSTIADLHQQKKIESISKSITINERFMFVNELFDGNKEAFQAAIESIDACETLDMAKSITSEHASNYNWDQKKDQMEELLTIISRKFTDS